jgi:galactose mutarotase-like enzyme
MYQLINEELVVDIAGMGAELKSIRDSKTHREFLWQGDPRYWGRTSPILFPLVGNYKNKEIRHEGKVYPLSQHGFARDMKFSLLEHIDQTIWFELFSTAKTLESFPFLFSLKVGYRLEGRCVTVMWKVANIGKETMYFSIGGHPAFNCPIDEKVKQTDCYLKFDVKDKIVSRSINPAGLVVDQFETFTLRDGYMPIKKGLFDKDALIIENQAHRVALTGADRLPYVTVTFEAPLFGLWSPAGKNAPFVCIEPWYGRSDHNDFTGDLSQREWGNQLAAEQEFDAAYTILV